MSWFDAHLDLAYLAVSGREMTADIESCGGPHPPAAVTLPSLEAGRVVGALGTIFTEPDGDGPEAYPKDDIEAAFVKGRAQLEVYLTWHERKLASLDLADALRFDPDVGETRGGMGVGEHRPVRAFDGLIGRKNAPALSLGILIENGDPIRSPDELEWWVARGVVAVGMAWWTPSRYAGGNGASGVALTGAGRALVQAMDQLGVIHDLSHLSQASVDELFSITDVPVMASHSNCRALLQGEDERHLSDETIAEIGRRSGVVGLNLVANFLSNDVLAGKIKRASIDDCVRHVEHVCEIMGHRRGVGLGSDMDGGFSAEYLPAGIDTPSDLDLITDGLEARGWSAAEIEGFQIGNWTRFLSERLSARPAVATAI